MKRILSVALCVLMITALFTGCGQAKNEAQSQELIVFAAASMQETMDEIAGLYTKDHPNVTITYNFDSSGTLKKQIQEGADCDLFISASPKQMNALDKGAPAEKNPDGLDFVLTDTRLNLLENKVVLAVPEGNPAGLAGYDDLAKRLEGGEVLLAMGNSDVPVGQYTMKIFNFYGLDEEKMASEGKITYCSNVKEVTSQVTEAAVDCGIIYATDAYSAGLKSVDTATADMCGQAIYPAAVMKESKNQETAKDFLAYLQTDAAAEVFMKVGFSPLT